MAWVVYEARRLGMTSVGRFVTVAFCVADANCLFETTEDCFLLLGGSCLSVLGLIHLWCNKNIPAKVAVFGAFVPIKSNAGIEAWQANVFDVDGVVDRASTRPHPNVDGVG